MSIKEENVQTMGWIRAVLLLGFLGIAAWIDNKKGMIPWYLPAAGAAAGFLTGLMESQMSIQDMLLGTTVGMAVLLIGFASRESIGYGDGLLLAASGIFIGWKDALILFAVSLLFCAIGSIVLMAFRRKRRKDRIPFAPFLLGGFVFLTGVYG